MGVRGYSSLSVCKSLQPRLSGWLKPQSFDVYRLHFLYVVMHVLSNPLRLVLYAVHKFMVLYIRYVLHIAENLISMYVCTVRISQCNYNTIMIMLQWILKKKITTGLNRNYDQINVKRGNLKHVLRNRNL